MGRQEVSEGGCHAGVAICDPSTGKAIGGEVVDGGLNVSVYRYALVTRSNRDA